MVLVAPQSVIDAPQRAPVPYGLFSVAAPVTNPGGLRWENGVTWMDQACEALPGAIVDDCADPVGLPKDFTSTLSAGSSAAFTVYGEFVCSPVGYDPDGAQRQAEARLLTREEQAVAAQVAALLTTADGPLEGTDLTAPSTSFEALAALEQHLAVNYGSQGVALLTLEALYDLGSDAIVRVGNGLQTLAGTPVVIERTGAVSGFTLGIIPMPVIFRGDVIESSALPGDLLDRVQNNMYAVAERQYAVGWLPCGGAYVDLSA